MPSPLVKIQDVWKRYRLEGDRIRRERDAKKNAGDSEPA